MRERIGHFEMRPCQGFRDRISTVVCSPDIPLLDVDSECMLDGFDRTVA